MKENTNDRSRSWTRDQGRDRRRDPAGDSRTEEPAGTAARRAALTVLGLVREGQGLDLALEEARDFGALDGPDRAFARAIASTVLRRRGTLDAVIDRFLERPLGKRGAPVQDILRVGAAQLVYLRTPAHAAVATAVSLAQARRETAGYQGLVNAVLRKVAEKGEAIATAQPERIDTPGWLWRAWDKAYGPAAAKRIALANREEAALDLSLKDPAAASDWAARLGGEALATGSVRLVEAGPVAEIDGYGDGAWWVQDAAAALPARLFGDLRGKTAIDLCAAPGGKTLQLAAAGADVIAVDRSAERLERLRENLQRTGLSARIERGDAFEFDPGAPADAVLLDAPCTATGTLRRRPDVAWSKTEADVAALADVQAKMIDRALDLLKPGGTLVYCVCSLQKEEGEAQMAALFARRPDAARAPVGAAEIGCLPALTPTGDVRTLPFMSGGMDGFFAARVTKRSS